jgi:Ca2+-binding RTX toxin-like protein
VDGPASTITSLIITSGLGTLINNLDGTWSYTPAANDDTSVTFSYAAFDGTATASSTASLDITPIANAPPVLDLDANNSAGGGSDYVSTFALGGPAVPITDVDVSIIDPDSSTLRSATITLRANGQVPPNDTLFVNGPLPAGISASAYNPTTGVLTLTGSASLAAYQTALHQVSFSTPDAFFNADRIISVAVNDGTFNSNTATAFIHVTGTVGVGVTLFTNDPAPYYAFSLDSQNVNAILAELTDVISAPDGQPLAYALQFYSPTTSASWSWLDQSAMPILSAGPAAITDADAGTYTTLLFAGGTGVSAVAFTILGDNAQEFDITVDSSGNDPGERGSGSRPIGDLIVVDDSIAGTVEGGGGDDVMWIRPGTGNHSLDGNSGDDALYGNAGNDTIDGGTGNNFVSGGGGDDVVTAGNGDDILLGGNGEDRLTAGNGDDVLFGGAGNDVLIGNGGNDVLIGGAGNDTLTCGGGLDQFVFAEAGPANVDHITDYQAGPFNIVDLSRLLDSHFTPTSAPEDFARVVQTGSDILVQVDQDGPASGANWQDVAVLDGYGTVGIDVVVIFFANQDYIYIV